jgi:uncharacterized SAM-binding protein YcdF (DUF218 family)
MLVLIPRPPVSPQDRRDAGLLWRYLQLGHELRRCDVAIGLGSHDLGVATYAAELYRRGLFPVIVFSGGTSPTTRDRFPEGEAARYRTHAIGLGMPDSAIIVEPMATNTGANITKSRSVLEAAGHAPSSILLISKPYAQRRSHATIQKLWPEVDVVCASMPLGYDEYVTSIGDESLVIDMMTGDLQRIIEYPARGFTVQQDVPSDVLDAYRRLHSAGFDSRQVVTSHRGTRVALSSHPVAPPWDDRSTGRSSGS